MKRNLVRLAALLVAAILIALLLGFLFVHDCSSVGGMGWSVVVCDCAGYEWLLYDRTEADGPKRSLCFGRLEDRQCFQYVDGPRIDCSELEGS
jgi:hypothetical protein